MLINKKGKKMKRIILSIAVLAALSACLFALSSCGGGHEHTWSPEYTVVTEATCTENGLKAHKCIDCDEYDMDTAAPIYANHKWGTEFTVDTPATCKTEGSKSVKCTVCGEANAATVTAIPTIAHTWGSPTVDKPATCTEDGTMSIKCTGCNEIKPDTTVPIPAGHSWASSASVIIPVTCTTDGSRGIKCLACGKVDEATVEVIPAGHVYDNVTVKVIATVFNDGLREGTCTRCNTEISETVAKTEANVMTFSTGTSTFKSTIPLTDLISDDTHFYPTPENPEGNDLFFEYSILLNSTTDKLNEGIWAISGIRDQSSANGNTPYWFYFKPNSKWCPFKGGFEADGGAGTELLYGPPCNDVNNLDGFVVIENYNGWHRIGWQVHQDTEIVGGKVKYTITTSLYIDGVKVHEMIPGNWLEENNLYFAKIEDGELVYSDNTNSKKHLFLFRMEKAGTTDGSTAYVPVADLYANCSKEFVIPVVPVADPADATFEVAAGVTLDGKVHFKVNDAKDCVGGNHAWANISTVDKNATCSEAGQKSIKCAVCGEIKADSIEVIPMNNNHEIDEYVVTKVATMFEEGIKRATCALCGTVDERVIPVTTPTVTKLNYDSPSHVVHNYTMEEVLDGKHFYPTEEDPDGKDLYIEFSLLWNETLQRTSGGIMAVGRISLNNTGDGNGLFYLNFKDGNAGSDCQFGGGFETGSREEQIYGPSMPVGGTADQYPFIGEYGWHRIGVQVHQETVIEDGFLTYYHTATLYVDGVKMSSHTLFLNPTNYLYYAIEENGEIVGYQDNDMNSRYVYAYRLDEFRTAIAGETAYFVTADVHVTCGNGFVLPVTPVEEPEDESFNASGETLDGSVFYAPAN